MMNLKKLLEVEMVESRGAGLSDTGRVRTHNEDSFLADDRLGLYVVADGMGGHAAGEVASRLAVDIVSAAVRGGLAVGRGRPTSGGLIRLARAAVETAAETVFARADENAALHGMGTTLTLLLVSGEWSVMAHVGDSRLYLLREGTLRQMSRDHTVVQGLVESGILSAEDARKTPFGHALARVVGTEATVEADVVPLVLRDGDRLLLCSDGLSDHLAGTSALAETLALPLADAPASLVAYANDAGGTDNITAIVVEVRGSGEASALSSESGVRTLRK